MTNIPNDTKLQGVVVDAILQKMGGIRPTAQKLNLSVSTVQGWKQRQMIPKNRVQSINVYFQQHFNMSIADFCNTTDTPKKKDTSFIPKTSGDKTSDTKIIDKKATISQKDIPKNTAKKNIVPPNKLSGIYVFAIIILCFFITVFVVLLSQSPIAKKWINQIYGYAQNSTDSKTDFATQTDMKNRLAPLQSQIDDIQSNRDKTQNTLSDIQTTQQQATTDIAQVKKHIQGIQDISDNMSQLYQQMDTMTQKLQSDITQIKNSVAIKTVYATEWRTLYMLIASGQPYAEILSTITIPETPDTKVYWKTIYTHKNGVISHQQIRTILYENAFLIAPALADASVKQDSSLMDRVRAKFTHFVFVTATPDGHNTSKNTDIDILFNAINTNDTAYIVRVLQPLNIPQLQPLLQRIEYRYQVLNAMRGIWQNLPQGDGQ